MNPIIRANGAARNFGFIYSFAPMVGALALLALGAVVLWAGAEAAIGGAGRLARAAGIPAFVLGALLFGIDVEGLGTALVAAGRGQTQLAAGEIFGTVVFLFGVGFGLATILAPSPLPAPSPTMVAAPALPVAAAAIAIFDRFVSRVDGVLLIAMYAGYVYLVLRERNEVRVPATETAGESNGRTRLPPAVVTVAGLGLLYAGATLLVFGGTGLLERTSLSAGFVGAAVVGALTSLDEVLLEVLPARRGDPELAIGNLFGTLAAFTSGVLGLAALVRPLDLDGAANATFLAMALLYAIVGTTFAVRGRGGRVLGAVCLACFVAWAAVTAAV